MYQAVDRCGCCHRVFEDLVPLAERQVAGQKDAAAFVAFRQKCEGLLSNVVFRKS